MPVFALIAWAPRGTRKGLVGQSPLSVLRSLLIRFVYLAAINGSMLRIPHFAIRIPNQFVAIELPLAERFSPHSNILSASLKIV